MLTTHWKPLAACAGLLLVASTGVAQPSNSNAQTIVGAWSVTVTLRNCDTGAQLGLVRSLVTFHADGTLSEGAATMAPGQRTAGHGVWRDDGGHTYLQHFAALIAFPTPAGPMGPALAAGWQTVTHTVELVAHDEFESAGTNSFYDIDGVLYRSGCSTAIGRRIDTP